MRHRVKKIKFKGGIDAKKMILKKLTINFLTKGKITTTKAKAKALKSFLERVINKVKKETEANKNWLFKKLGNKQFVKILFKQIGPALKEKTSGYLKQISLGQRISDGAEMLKIEWSAPVVLEKQKNKKKIISKLESKKNQAKK